MITSSIAADFNSHFKVVFADADALKEEAYRIRYQVYCQELGYEDPDEFPDGLEKDGYDAHSRHCLLLHRSSGLYAGCIRLVLPDPDNPDAGLPYEKICAGELHPELMEGVPATRQLLGEYSRLAVPEQFRRRKGEKLTLVGNLGTVSLGPNDMRRFAHIPLGLYLAAAAVAVASGLDGVVAMMQPRGARHLRRFGMVYTQIGNIVDHRGPRAPFYCSRKTLFKYIDPGMRKLLDDILCEMPGSLTTGIESMR
jgi:N-acyl amino acid synthase of PEP-CTERM/exosortase system